MTSDGDRPETSIEATAYSKVDGVETWDLTGEPSDEAFGIKGGSSAGIYETPGKPRRVRIVLPGRTVEMEAVLVTFYRAPGIYSFSVRSAELKPEPLTTVFREVLGQLDGDGALADEFAQKVAAAPPDQSEVIEVGVGVRGAVTLGQWTVSPSVNISPLAGAGRVIFSGAWPPS